MNQKTIVIAIGFLIAFCIGIFFYAEWQKQKFDASLPEPPAPTEVQAAETETEGGHWHGDEWHAEPHNVNFVTPIADSPEVDFSVQPTAAPETESDAQFSAELAEILATPKYAEKLQRLQRMLRKGYYSPEWVEWDKKMILLEAEEELLEREYPFWAPDGTATLEEIEKHVYEENQRIANMTQEERQALADKFEAHMQKHEDWSERRKAHEAKMPSSVSGGKQ